MKNRKSIIITCIVLIATVMVTSAFNIANASSNQNPDQILPDKKPLYANATEEMVQQILNLSLDQVI